MSRRTTAFRPQVNRLEDRCNPAGNLRAFVDPLGDLYVLGDFRRNQVALMSAVIKSVPMVRVIPQGTTTVNGAAKLLDFPGVTRNIYVALGSADDTLDMALLKVKKHLVVHGNEGNDVVTFNPGTLTVGGTLHVRGFETQEQRAMRQFFVAQGVPATPNVMQIKLQQAIEMLQRPNQDEDLYRRAIDEAMEAIYTSNLVVLPTAGNAATNDMFEVHRQMAQQAIDALTQHIDGPNLGGAGNKGHAHEARNFIQITSEAMQVLGQQTSQTNPYRPSNNPLLNQTDEAGTYVDTVLGNIFTREVRSPFFVLPNLSAGFDEQVIKLENIAPNDCAVVVKEFQGIKAIVTPRDVPIWVEPWFARAQIVGFKRVWVWEFVPAEVIKTISFCNVPGPNNTRKIVTDVQTTTVLERQLLHFWRHINKNVTAV